MVKLTFRLPTLNNMAVLTVFAAFSFSLIFLVLSVC